MGINLETDPLLNTRQHILQTLAYFDIFHYPLLIDEIIKFHGEPCSQLLIDEALEELLQEQLVYFIDGFYSLHNDHSLATKRRQANQLAAEQMKTAYKAAKILSRFPYVKALAISGSLSKNYGSEKADIDFFIITNANRLWIARTIMHLYKKYTFLTGTHNWFCMNYYVDEAAPQIGEKNIFTAMEIVTLLPMYGQQSLDNFMKANEWVKNYFPLANTVTKQAGELKKRFFGRICEKLFNNSLGNVVDNWLMKITNRRWQKKTARNQKNDKGNTLGMMVSKHCSKPDPKNFQAKVVKEYYSKLELLLQPKIALSKVQ